MDFNKKQSKLYQILQINIQGLAEATPRSVVGRGCDVSHEMDSSLNISPKMSHGVLQCDSVTLQNYMLMIL